MYTIMIFSESGGATKTTTAVSLAMCAAEAGTSTLLIDLDPRGATTKWTRVQPEEGWRNTAAIIASEDPDGWAEDLALPSLWNENLRVIPSGRELANRERDIADHMELRLSRSLDENSSDLIVIDCPNRQGGPLTQNALAAADGVVYAATPDQDGLDGVDGARESVARFLSSRRRMGADPHLDELGIVIGKWPDTIPTKVAKEAANDLEDTGILINPKVPKRTIVEQARMAGEWYGNFPQGNPVADAYAEIVEQTVRPKLEGGDAP
ncbi:ParA family protein [Corynebacterium sanguinis]|uniref:ParA family protein n=1 Tax=Corynebacterium sanguinis TaxID=2594913 RepID=A0A6C1TV67_9CORY|nr:ParA family protein [Corynebacterium sanguinis]TVS26959.1 ParA family protein [Corynebacterium sanguinis]